MAVTIKFTADFTDVQAQLDRVIADARAHPIPLGGSFGGVTGGLGGGSPTPTTAGVFGAAAIAAAGSFGSVNPVLGSSFLQTVGGFGAQFANPGFFNAQFGASGGGFAAGIFGFPGSPSSAVGGAGPGGSEGAVGMSGAIQRVVASRVGGGGFSWGGGGGGGMVPPGAGAMILSGGGGDWTAQAGPGVTNTFNGGGTDRGYGNYGMGGGGGGGLGGFGGGGAAGGVAAGRGGGGFNGFLGRGFGRLVGAGYLLRIGEGVAEAEQKYSIASVLAQNDQHAQLDAQMTLRGRLIASAPLIGNFIDVLNDPGGFQQAGIQATIRSADAQEDRTRLRKGFGKASAILSDEASVAGLEGPLRSEAQLRADHRQRLDSIAERGLALGASDQQRIQDNAATLESDRQGKANRIGLSNKTGSATGNIDTALSQLEIQDRAEIAGQRSQSAAKLGALLDTENAKEASRYNRERAALSLQTGRESFLESTALQGSAAVFNAMAKNSPEAASRLALETSVANANLKAFETPGVTADVLSATIASGRARLDADASASRIRNIESTKTYNDSIDIQQQENQAARARLAGQPLAAALGDNQAARLRATRGLDVELDSKLFNSINEGFDISDAQLNKNDTTGRRQRNNALDAKGRILDIELKSGVFGKEVADSASIKEQAFLKVGKLIDEGAAGNKNEIAKTFQNAQKEEELSTRDFLRRFKPQEIDINRSASGNLGGNDAIETLKSMDDNLKAIKEASQNWGKAQ